MAKDHKVDKGHKELKVVKEIQEHKDYQVDKGHKEPKELLLLHQDPKELKVVKVHKVDKEPKGP